MNHIYTHWPKYLSYMIGVALHNPPPRFLVYKMRDNSTRMMEYPVQ